MKKFDLDAPLFQWRNGNVMSGWTIGNSVEGLQIFGGIGSGKSSGSARFIANKLLLHGYGGLVLTCKADERDNWVQYCKETHRTNDLIIVEPGGKYHFDFMKYLSSLSDDGNAITENLVSTLKIVIQAGEEKSSGKSDDPFWEASLTMLISSVIDVCMIAYRTVGIQKMYDIVQTLPNADAVVNQKADPNAPKDFETAFKKASEIVRGEVDKWYRTFDFNELEPLLEDQGFEALMMEAVPNARLLKILDQFFFETFKNLSSKTKGVILFSFSSFLFKLLREPIYSLFCNGKINVRPEDCLDGKIILLNIPVKVYHNTGRDCQIMFKHLFQMAMEKRDVSRNDRPVLLFADESQFFTTEYDQVFQATARSSRVATIYITQNLQQYFSSMGGTKFVYRVKSFLGTLNTKIFMMNADYETNEYASQLIGEAYFEDESNSMNYSKKESSNGMTRSYKLERVVRPEEFMTFKCGGKKNGHIVQGIFHMQGPPIMNGQNFKKMAFNQLT